MCVWEFAMGSVFFAYFSMCLSLEILKFVDCSLNLSLRLSNTLSCCCLLAHCFFLCTLKVLLHVLNVQCCTGEVHGHPDSDFLIWYFSTFSLAKLRIFSLPTLFCNFLIMGFYVGWLLYWDWFLRTILIWILVFSVLWCVFISLTSDFLCLFLLFFFQKLD